MRVSYLIAIVLLLVGHASCEVRVSASLSKPEYLAGEPVEVIVTVMNIGFDPVVDEGPREVALEVVGEAKRPEPPDIWGCFAGEGFGYGNSIGVDHPPHIEPGASKQFRAILRGYDLRSGHYSLRASGVVDIRTPSKSSGRGDLVPGSNFDQTLTLTVRAATENQLRATYEPYVMQGDSPSGYEARDAINEMAPTFLEKTILQFAVMYPNEADAAIRGLSRIDTAETRRDLVGLYDSTTDWKVAESIVRALAQMNSKDQIKFFAGLLPGHVSPPEDRIRQYAILAIGRLDGNDGVEILRQFLRADATKMSEHTRYVVAIALANGGSRRAVPVLINMYRDPSDEVQSGVCDSLESLTHRNWCDGTIDIAGMQSEWRSWWAKNSSTVRIFGTNECPAENVVSPGLRAPN